MQRALLLHMILQGLLLNLRGSATAFRIHRHSHHALRCHRLFATTSSNPAIDELVNKIVAQGNAVREMKAAKAEKDQIKLAVNELLSLKSSYKSITGYEYGAEMKQDEKSVDTSKGKAVSAKVAETPVKVTTPVAKDSDTRIDEVAGPVVNYFNIRADDSIDFGDFSIINSEAVTGRKFANVASLSQLPSSGVKLGERVWVRGRVSNVRAKGNVCFIVLRSDVFHTIQLTHFKDKENPEPSKQLIKFAGSLALETVVDVYGTLVAADVKSCTQNDVEISIRKLFVVSRAPSMLPFLLEDASRSEAEIEASQNTERPFAKVTQDVRLNNRWLDLRVPANNAIMRIKSGVTMLFRESLMQQGFTEIITPKLIAGESEGGADVFRTDYFGQPACLAQSPQLYKQMAISADMGRVFEIGPVFRAENSNTRRHLCEFTGYQLL